MFIFSWLRHAKRVLVFFSCNIYPLILKRDIIKNKKSRLFIYRLCREYLLVTAKAGCYWQHVASSQIDFNEACWNKLNQFTKAGGQLINNTIALELYWLLALQDSSIKTSQRPQRDFLTKTSNCITYIEYINLCFFWKFNDNNDDSKNKKKI